MMVQYCCGSGSTNKLFCKCFCDGAHLTSLGIEFQTEEEAKENEQSPSVALLCAGLFRRGMVYELERVMWVCDGFL